MKQRTEKGVETSLTESMKDFSLAESLEVSGGPRGEKCRNSEVMNIEEPNRKDAN